MQLEPQQFFAEFLQLSIVVTGSQGGAIWVLQPQQTPQCYCHLKLELCGIQQPEQQKIVVEAIDSAVKEEKLVILPANTGNPEESGGNLANCPLFLKPLKAAGKVAMVLQIIGTPQMRTEEFRMMAGLLERSGEAAETYLAHRRAVVLEDDRKALTRLLQFSETVHTSMDPEKVIYQIANGGRDTIGCSRVVVWVDPKVKRGLRAVSGVDKADRRAVLMQAIEKLSKHCLFIKKPIISTRQQLVEMLEDDELKELLMEYYNVSQLDQIFVQPIKVEQRYLGTLVAEGFEDVGTASLAGLISNVANHSGIALDNALQLASSPMFKPLAKMKSIRTEPKRKRKWLFAAIIVIAALTAACYVPWPVTIKVACELSPSTLRTVQCELDQVKVSQIVTDSGNVTQGQLIAQLDDLDFVAEKKALELALDQERLKRDQSIPGSSEQKTSELQIKRLENSLDLVSSQIERCQVRSPIEGVILTADLERLEGQVIGKGETICEVASFDQWQLRLDVPQEEVDWLRKRLAGGGDGTTGEEAPVYYFLEAFPQFKLQASINNVDQIGQMPKLKQDGNVYEVRIGIPAERLVEIREGLRNGMVGRSKIETVEKPFGFVLLRKVIRFFRVTFF